MYEEYIDFTETVERMTLLVPEVDLQRVREELKEQGWAVDSYREGLTGCFVVYAERPETTQKVR